MADIKPHTGGAAGPSRFYLVHPGQVRACLEAPWGALLCFILCTQLATGYSLTTSSACFWGKGDWALIY